MSLFRRSFSRRLPDRLHEISERIYVFDSCFANSVMNENEFRSYLGTVVTSLHRFHAGASFMVFNFSEGDQTSLLADILIDYDMTVVDYPRHYEGYPLLPLEMIHYFLRSSESWLSLEGQKNVILMHCQKGGWPVLAFMLAGLLLYRKQYKGEQKTLEMVFKQAPKEITSVMSRINPRASQLRYLRYITGRDLASDWPPSDAPLIVDYLLLHNLPVFNAGKGCRPVVRLYGQDPSAKGNRNPRLLLSTSMAEEPAWQYPKEECVFVKLELLCHVQGDVFLECLHLHDDYVAEEMIFKAMFHTGFIQANILALDSDDIDVSWNPKYKLPKDFKAEVLFRDINEAPTHIAMELGSVEDYHDSDNEFFEVEEIFTPMSVSPEPKADLPVVLDLEASLQESRNKDCTLHNGAPRWDFESEVADLGSSKDILLDEGSSTNASERVPQIEETLITEFSSFKERCIDEGWPKQASEKEAAEGSNQQALGAEPVLSAPKDIERADPIISAPKDIVGANPSSISAHKHIVGADPVTSAPKDIVGPDPVISAPKDIVGANPVISVPKAIEGANPTITAHKEFVDADPIRSAPKDIVGADPVISASKDIVGADPVKNAPKDIVGADPVKNAAKDIVGADAEISTPKDIVIDNTNYKRASETGFDTSAPNPGSESSKIASKNIVLVDAMYHKQASETESDIRVSESIVEVDISNHKEASETQSEVEADEAHDIKASEFITSALKNIVVDDRSHIQAPKTALLVNAPGSGAESDISASKNTMLVDDRNLKQVSELKDDSSESKNTVVLDIGDYKQTSETQSDDKVLKNNIVTVDRNHKQASDIKPEVSGPKKIIVVDDRSQTQDVKVKIEPKTVPSSSKTKQQKKNKWHEITAKTITQQRVVSQWVPRAKPPATEATKPKAPTYKWVPKGTATPTGEK